MSKPLRTRRGITEFLNVRGFPVAEASLATWACRGGGPPFQKFGVKPLYDEDEALAWAEARMSKRENAGESDQAAA